MNEYDFDLDFIIANAMNKVRALCARGTHYNNIAIVVTPSVYQRLARRSGYQWREDIRIDSTGYYGRYNGFDIYIVENNTDEYMCFPAFHYESNERPIPLHPGEYFIFGNNEELYQTNDGVTLRDSGMRVTREVNVCMTYLKHNVPESFVKMFENNTESIYDDGLYDWRPTYLNSWLKVQKPEPELQPTPELDEFIEQFRRSS